MSRAPLAALALLVVASCSSNASPRSGGSSASTQASTSKSPAPTAPPKSTSTAAVCEAAARPPGAVRVTEGSGDVDGDGRPDAIAVYAEGAATSPGPWHLLVTLGGGQGRITATITDAVSGDAAQRTGILGASAITPGRSEALFVSVGSGASATVVGLFAASGCTLSRVAIAPGNAPAQFPIGGAVTHLNGLRCRAQQLEQLSATSVDGITYSTSIQRLVLSGSTLQPEGEAQTGTLAASDPALADFSTLSCPGVTSP